MRGVTKQQIEQAKQMDLLTYMMTYEPQELVRVGAHDYRTRTHDSLCISDNGLWHWCSRNIGGKTALNYLISVKGMDFVSAVRCLCETEPEPALFQQVKPSISAKSEENKPFALPALDAGNEAALAYLRRRCIHEKVLQTCVAAGIVAQTTRSGYKNCVFIGRGKDGAPHAASLRGCNSKFRGDVTGSDKSYGFCLPAASRDSTRLEIYEAPIDAMSGASLHLMAKADWRSTHYLAINGLNYMAADRFLDAHPQIKMVRLCLDNDERGRDFAERLAEHLAAHGLTVRITPPALGKDYNDMLIILCNRMKSRSERQGIQNVR